MVTISILLPQISQPLKKVCIGFNISPDARDSGIQIFDKFLTVTLAENKVSQIDTNVVSYAAAVSILLGSKLHDTRRELTMVTYILYIIYVYCIFYIFKYGMYCCVYFYWCRIKKHKYISNFCVSIYLCANKYLQSRLHDSDKIHAYLLHTSHMISM